MYRKTVLSNFVGIALALLSGGYHPPQVAPPPRLTPSSDRRGGKGKGRPGASKPSQRVHVQRQASGRGARRRRAKLALRRG